MNMQRLMQVALAAVLIAGVSLSPTFIGNSQVHENEVQVADGGWPPPDECGLYDICRVTENS